MVMDKIITALLLLFGMYVLVLLAVACDLISGVRKAKRAGVVRSSYGFRRTVDKLARYYNLLIAISFVDCLQMAAIWYMEVYYGYKIVMFPFITLLGAIGVCLIEVKSIYEKAEDKVKIDEAISLTGKVIASKDDLSQAAKEIAEYLKKD